MKPSLLRASALLCMGFLPLASPAYELRTHAALTFEAYKRSNLAQNPKILESLGFTGDKAQELGSIYYDVQGNNVRIRNTAQFELDRMPDDASKIPRSIPGYITRGAIREDDITTFGCLVDNVFKATKLVDYFDLSGCNPRDDPYGDIERVLNHFYDPIYNRGLTVPGIPPIVPSINGVAAPTWALGVTDAFSQPNQPNPGRRNHFSVIDARQAMLAALSGAAPGSNTPLNETDRNTWWATTFRSLGDMLHLLQDMSQPQHTKNEPHPGSYLEKYTDLRAAQDTANAVAPNGLSIPLPPLEFGSYPKPAFPRFSDYWSTAPVDSVVVGRGLADYAHRGFLTAKNNIVPAKKMAAYPFPSPRIESYTVEAQPVELPDEQDPMRTKTYQVTYLRGDVPDTLAGGSNNIRMATPSALSKFTKDQVN
ncbi:MAG: hypothetical protein JNM52_01290, partial [Betaproteobacteria bacterium]|nr:hypothetical protein [Betaproteobacteria bacterium]